MTYGSASIVSKAISLAINDKSPTRFLTEKYKISRNKASVWLRKENIATNPVSINNKKKRELIKSKAHSILYSQSSINSDLLCLEIIYGCEASKYPATSGIRITNSDSNLIKAFLLLFRKTYKLDEEKFRINLQIHTTHNVDEISKWWSNLLNIPLNKFIKPTITSPNGKKVTQTT